MSDLLSMGESILARVSNEEHRQRLEGLVIPPSFAEEKYIPRELPGGRTETELYLRSIERGKHPLLMGPAGSGKTWSPFNFASLTGMPLAVIEGHAGFDPTQVFATREQDPETGRWYWEITDVGLVWVYNGIILIDEEYRVPAKSSGVFFSMLDSRHRAQIPGMGMVRAADGLLIAGTTNPPEYAGVGEVDLALVDRHSPVLEWGYDAYVEATLIRSTYLREMAGEVRKRGDLSGVMSTRNMIEFEDLVDDLGWEMGVAGLLGRFGEYEAGIVEPILQNWSPKIREELGV